MFNEDEFSELNTNHISDQYDGVFIAPGPYKKPHYFNRILKTLRHLNIPVLGTGEIYYTLVKFAFELYDYDVQGETVISNNLNTTNQFTQVMLDQLSPEISKLYLQRGTVEYSSSRYSILPQFSDILSDWFIIGARNQYFDPEILKDITHPFFMFTMFCPQMNSSEDIPHPIITYFVKSAIRLADIKETELEH